MKTALYCTFVCLCFLISIDRASPADFNAASPVSMASVVYDLYQEVLDLACYGAAMKTVDFRYEKRIPYTFML